MIKLTTIKFYSLTMKLFVAKDVFETNKFCYFYSKLVNFVFVTIFKSENGFYTSKTSKWDILRFTFGFIFAIYIFYKTLLTSIQQEKRSIIFEIILSLNSKMQTMNISAVMLHGFIYRHEYFEILKTIHWIDFKVIL